MARDLNLGIAFTLFAVVMIVGSFISDLLFTNWPLALGITGLVIAVFWWIFYSIDKKKKKSMNNVGDDKHYVDEPYI